MDVHTEASGPLWLPQEICEHILDYLWDDTKALKTCSLSSRAWLHATRRHLFRTVQISEEAEFKRFRGLLDQAPEIGSCVRELSFTGRLDDPEVPPTFRVMNNLDHLYIKGSPDIAQEIKENPSTFFGTVRTLQLNNVHFSEDDLPRILCGSLRLSSLTWTHVFWKPSLPLSDNLLSSIIPLTPIAIQELTIESSSIAGVFWLLDGPLSLRLRSLTVLGVDRRHSEQIQRLLDGSSSTLEHFTIASNLEGLEDLDLSRHTQLRTLAIKDVDVDGRRRHRQPESYAWILSLLSTLDSACLQEIHLGVRLFSPADVSILRWDAIDEQLARQGRQREGFIARFRAHNITAGHAFTDQVLDTIVSRLPVLKSTRASTVVICSNTRNARGAGFMEQEFWVRGSLVQEFLVEGART